MSRPSWALRPARVLEPHQVEAVLLARRAGVGVTALAAEYGVSRRTIQRYIKRDAEPHVCVAVESWEAVFVITDEGPVQMSPWYAARKAA